MTRLPIDCWIHISKYCNLGTVGKLLLVCKEINAIDCTSLWEHFRCRDFSDCGISVSYRGKRAYKYVSGISYYRMMVDTYSPDNLRGLNIRIIDPMVRIYNTTIDLCENSIVGIPIDWDICCGKLLMFGNFITEIPLWYPDINKLN